LLHII